MSQQTQAAPAAPATKTEDKKAAPAAAKVEVQKAPEAPKLRLRAVHGLIIHPFTHTHFDTEGTKVHEVDSWVRIQMEAGKLVESE